MQEVDAVGKIFEKYITALQKDQAPLIFSLESIWKKMLEIGKLELTNEGCQEALKEAVEVIKRHWETYLPKRFLEEITKR